MIPYQPVSNLTQSQSQPNKSIHPHPFLFNLQLVIPIITTARLRQIPNPISGTRPPSTLPSRTRRHKTPRLQTPLNIKAIPRLIQTPPLTPQHNLTSRHRTKRILNLLATIRLLRTGRNPRCCKSFICIEGLEEGDGAVEEIDDFVAGVVGVAVASGAEGVDACAVFVPFVLPEGLGGSAVGEPVSVHVC